MAIRTDAATTVADGVGSKVLADCDWNEAATWKRVALDSVAEADLFQLGIEAFRPLTGFMNEDDYLSVCEDMRLVNHKVWSIPVVLPITEEDAKAIHLDDKVALVNDMGTVLGAMIVTSMYKPDKTAEAASVYGTTELAHPGVRQMMQRGAVYIGGPVRARISHFETTFPEYLFTPKQCKQEFERRGWKTIVGFQTRNPIHRAHEYIQKCALETVDGLFLHPLVGPTKADDVPAKVRVEAYLTILKNYYPENRTFFGVYTSAMRYAGPREAIMHALARKNFGCTHFIVGRDHAGVGHYYGTYDAQKIFSRFNKEELGITPVFFDHAFYCKACGSMATAKTCPHDDSQHIILSGTKVRGMLAEGIAPPPEYSRKEVVEVLMSHYASRAANPAK